MKTLLLLALEFFKIGLFAVGGGYATLPFLMDLTEKYPWFTKEKLADMIAISESTPGPLGINMSTFAGFQAAGVLGAAVATFFLVLPSYITIVIVASFLKKFNSNPYVQGAFAGLRPAVVGLVGYSIWEILSLIILPNGYATADGVPASVLAGLNLTAAALIAAFFALQCIPRLKNLHPLVWIAAGAAMGIIFKL